MRKSMYLFLVVMLLPIFAYSNDPVLMKINGKPVLKSEFEYIYNKNNSNNSLDKKTLNEYVDLFVNFKLKVEEAKAKGIDTTKSFIDELRGYRSQLTRPYLTDAKIEEAVLQEAYNRMKEEVEVSHILIRIPPNATPADTLAAFKKIQSIALRVAKEDFAKVAKEVSEDESARENSGLIGYITAFRTVYPFETVAYNTQPGTISKPVRTNFGYHLVKVHGRRASQGEILVAHIMRFTEQGNEAKNAAAKATIDSIYHRIKAGDDFAKLATSLSEDRGSATKGGELPWFGSGRMIPEFENAAFSLKSKGDFGKPIQSAFGWHIIKLIDKRGLASFENLKEDIENKVKRDERALLGQKSFIKTLKAAYNYTELKPNIQEIAQLLGSKSLSDSVFQVELAKLSKPIIEFADKTFTQSDFAVFLKSNTFTDKTTAIEIIDEKIDAFADNKLLEYEDSQLENKYVDFRFLMQEYHDGILLFEISNNEVWEKASKDTEGLAKFFKANKKNYKWDEPHYKGRVIRCKDAKTMKLAKAIVKQSHTDSIDKYLNSRLNDSIQYVKIEKNLFVKGENKYVDKFVFKSKNAIEVDKEFPYVFVTGKLLRRMPEDYTDVRGRVTADYQEYLEKEWITALRKKYTVEIDTKVLETIQQN